MDTNKSENNNHQDNEDGNRCDTVPELGSPLYDLGPDHPYTARQILRTIESARPMDVEQKKIMEALRLPRTVLPLNHEDRWDDWKERSKDPKIVQEMWELIFGPECPKMNTYEMRAIIKNTNSRLLFHYDDDKGFPCDTDCYDPIKGRYWRMGVDGQWNSYSVTQYKNRLFRIGRQNIKGIGGAPNEIQSDIDAVTERQAMITEGMSGCQAGIHKYDDRLYLARYGYKMIEPDGEIDPVTTMEWLEELLGVAGIHRFLDWLHHAVTNLLDSNRGQSRILAIAGPPGCGKSFLIREVVRLLLGGRAADAAPWLLGTTDFASELGGAELLYIDDALGDNRIATRLGVAAKQKQIVTAGSKSQPMHAKGKDRYYHPVWWRHVVAVNDTAEALSMLPPLDEGYGDKLILLRGKETKLSKGGDNTTGLIETILSELPGLMSLVLVRGCKGETDGRGPLAWHDPELSLKLREAAPEYSLAGMLLEAFENGDPDASIKKPLIEPPLNKLDRALRRCCGDRYSKLCQTDRVTRKYLGRLEADGAISSRKLNGITRWNLEKLQSWLEAQNAP